MAALIQAFNAQTVDPTQGVGGLPIGRHPVIVESSEVKPNKENNGGYLQLNLKLIDGPQAGAVGAYRINLYHSNQQTVEIAHRQLSAVCHVTGVFMLQDSTQLHGIPFVVEVAPQKNDPRYTEVKKVFDINGNEPGKAGQGQAPAQPAAAPAQNFSQPQAQEQAPQGNASAWGQQPAQQPAATPAGAPAWGNQQQAPAAAQQQPAAAGWQQGAAAPAGGNPPWAQR